MHDIQLTVAQAIWNTWRDSELAPDSARAIDFTTLQSMAGTVTDTNLPCRLLALAMAEAQAAIDAATQCFRQRRGEDPETAAAFLQASFDLRWRADMRATARWQAATGLDPIWPDHADLCVWLLKQLEADGWIDITTLGPPQPGTWPWNGSQVLLACRAATGAKPVCSTAWFRQSRHDGSWDWYWYGDQPDEWQCPGPISDTNEPITHVRRILPPGGAA